MYDLSQSAEDVLVAETARRLALGPVDQAAREVDRTGTIPADLWRQLRDFGFTAPVAEQLGGTPDAVTHLRAVESLAHGDPGIVATATLAGAAASIIDTAGTEEQRSRLLAGVVDGSCPAPALALYERYGLPPEEHDTTITAEDDGWRVRGTKYAVALLDGVTELLVVGVDPQAGPRAVVVGLDQEGVDAKRVSGTSHLALTAARLSTVHLDVLVTADDLLGGVDADARSLAFAVARTRLLAPAVALGGANRAREYATTYAAERIAFGRPLLDFQGISFTLVDDQMRLDAARLGLLALASRLDQGYADALADVSRIVNETHAATTEATRNAIQVLGGHGFLADHPVEMWYRAAGLLSTLDADPYFASFAPAV